MPRICYKVYYALLEDVSEPELLRGRGGAWLEPLVTAIIRPL